MFMSHSCVDFPFVPSGKFIVSGLLVFRLLFTGAPSIMNTFFALVSAIACDILIVIAFRHCCVGVPNMLLAVAVIDDCCVLFVVYCLSDVIVLPVLFGVITVLSLLLSSILHSKLVTLLPNCMGFRE